MPLYQARFLPLFAAVCMILAVLAIRSYRLLDTAAVVISLVIFFVAPIIVMAFLSRGSDRSIRQAAVLRGFLFSGFAMLLWTTIVFANGALDRSEPVDEPTVVVQKCVSHGKGGPAYSLRVAPSWRPGHDEERLPVNYSTFASVHAGEAIQVEVHHGLFGLPWFGHISPS